MMGWALWIGMCWLVGYGLLGPVYVRWLRKQDHGPNRAHRYEACPCAVIGIAKCSNRCAHHGGQDMCPCGFRDTPECRAEITAWHEGYAKGSER